MIHIKDILIPISKHQWKLESHKKYISHVMTANITLKYRNNSRIPVNIVNFMFASIQPYILLCLLLYNIRASCYYMYSKTQQQCIINSFIDHTKSVTQCI